MSDVIFCLMGPTASGKTDLVYELVNHASFEVISVDSALIYRGMDIGTAKPSVAELQKVPHHLIDIIDPIDSYSAAQFCSDALLLCDKLTKKGRIPLLVGGTMMYFNALQKGLSSLPEADERIRTQLDGEIAQLGLRHLYQKLIQVDPVTAERIHAHDAQRVQRALEVYYITGIPLSSYIAEQKSKPNYSFINLALVPEDRSWLHARIAQRFDHMLSLGFIDEVVQLQKKWNLQNNLPSMRCVGYRQVLEYLEGQYDYSELKEKGIAATRQLAKRQLTWLRHWDEVSLFDPKKTTFINEIIEKVKKILDNKD